MSDEKFWLGVCTIFAVITLGTVSLVTGCVTKNTEMASNVVNSAVQKGIDPVVAKCAMLVGTTSNISPAETAICLVQKGIDPVVAKCAMLVGTTSNISPAETAICLSAKK